MPDMDESLYERSLREWELRRQPRGWCHACGAPLNWREGDDGNDEYVCMNPSCLGESPKVV